MTACTIATRWRCYKCGERGVVRHKTDADVQSVANEISIAHAEDNDCTLGLAHICVMLGFFAEAGK